MKNNIKKTTSLIKKHLVSGKITETDNIHLTLKFLGDIPDERYEDVVRGVDEAVDKIHPFNMGLDKIGYFDKKSKFRVLWIGITGELIELNEYFHILDDSLHIHGFDKDFRDYSPHITIGRNIKLDDELETINQKLPIDYSHICKVAKLYIYNSISVDGKRVYKKIKEYNLV